MNCCEHPIVIIVQAKCSDMCAVDVVDGKTEVPLFEHDGYVPRNLGIGGGDYVSFDFCATCGQMMGSFPIPMDVISAALSKGS
jgi:hypothetical protein